MTTLRLTLMYLIVGLILFRFLWLPSYKEGSRYTSPPKLSTLDGGFLEYCELIRDRKLVSESDKCHQFYKNRRHT